MINNKCREVSLLHENKGFTCVYQLYLDNDNSVLFHSLLNILIDTFWYDTVLSKICPLNKPIFHIIGTYLYNINRNNSNFQGYILCTCLLHVVQKQSICFQKSKLLCDSKWHTTFNYWVNIEIMNLVIMYLM